MDASNRRVVILGKTGAGKSSLANTLFGETLFKVIHTSKSRSKSVIFNFQTRSDNRRRLTLMDTHGFFDTDVSEQDLKSEIIKWITECAPGPHAFLILLKVERYTKHERAMITKIKESFSEEVFKYATVVFTHGDQLQEGQTIEDFVREEENLRELVRKCGGRCHVIDNKYWKENPTDEYRSNKFQVKQLLKTIDKMIKDNKDGYTNEMLQEVEEEKQEKMKLMKQPSGNLSEDAPMAEGAVGSSMALSASNKRVVILGKTGAGKSSLANTIFGETLYKVDHKSKSETRKCQKAETRSDNRRRLTLIDTPGFFDTDVSERDLKPEIIRCITECAPGLHAFLIVLKVERYTERERAVITKIKESFSEEAFKYATVVFTHGEQLQEGQTIEDFVREEENLRELVRKCGGRCHVVDNKYWKENPTDEYRSNKFQVEQLLKRIDEMIEDNKDGYTNEMLQAVEEEKQRERERIMKQSGASCNLQ